MEYCLRQMIVLWKGQGYEKCGKIKGLGIDLTVTMYIRVDSSVQIGIGHLMRCLTLADALREKESNVSFICRELSGNLCDFVVQKGIGVNVHYIPVHTQPYFRRLGFSSGQFPEAERYYEEAVTLPLFPLMSKKEQDYIISVLRETPF